MDPYGGRVTIAASELNEMLTLPVPDLLRRARMGLQLFPDIPAMMDHLARYMADEICSNNERKTPTRWIVPIGPVAQYSIGLETYRRPHG